MLKNFEYKNIVAALFTCAIFLELTDTFIVNVAFPEMVVQLNTSVSLLSWVLNAYLLSIAMAIPVCAWLGDKFGTKRVFLCAISLFTLASVLCALSQNISLLIFARVLQGMGAGMMVPVGQTMMFRAFPKQDLIRVMSLIALPVMVAPAASQVLGGVIVQYFGWRWIFLVNLPIGMITFALAWRYLREDILDKHRKLNILGILFSSSAFVLIFYSLSKFELNRSYQEPFLYLAVALVLFAAFILYSLKTKNPILDLRVYANPHFRLSSLVFVLIMSSCMGSNLVANFLFQDTLLLTPFQAGLLNVPFCVGMMLLMRPLPNLYKKYGPVPLLSIGCVIYVVGTLMMIHVQSADQLWEALVLNLLRGFGQGFLGLVLQSSALYSMPNRLMGHASSLLSMSWYLSVSLGVAAFTLMLSLFMSLQGVMPVSFVPAHKLEVVVTFKWIYVISCILYVAGNIAFLSIKNRDYFDPAKQVAHADDEVPHLP